TKTPTLYIPDTTVESDGDLSITTLNLTLTSPDDTTVDSSEITSTTSSRQVQLTFNLTEDTTKLALIDEPNSITISARIFEIITTDGPIIVYVNLTVVEESTLFKISTGELKITSDIVSIDIYRDGKKVNIDNIQIDVLFAY
ncbi:uncharacterized protein LOC117118311, partial [Anneissia japonica]|uniref:uncharacterized protein LOC117118311 n=1 Tax=Anneissia japonica TaxID=1529436 RepID=UPI0014255604